jgi:hypothetical protein
MKNTNPTSSTTSPEPSPASPDAAATSSGVDSTSPNKVREFKQHRAFQPEYNSDETLVGLVDFVIEAGATLNCRFTFEEIASTKSRTSALEGAEVTPANVQSVAELVSKLKNDLEEVHVEAVTWNGQFTLIRLIETSLVKKAGYALDLPVTMEFQGTLHNLIAALNKQLPAIGPVTMGGIPMDIEDYTTQTSIAVKRQPVRDVLTNAVPLRNYGPLLWVAKTRDQDGSAKTEVRFCGAQKQK